MLAATIALARQRRTVALTTYASLTAKPLFERHGFVVTEERHFLSRDIELTNVAMRCELGAAHTFEGCVSRHTLHDGARSDLRDCRPSKGAPEEGPLTGTLPGTADLPGQISF